MHLVLLRNLVNQNVYKTGCGYIVVVCFESFDLLGIKWCIYLKDVDDRFVAVIPNYIPGFLS